MEEIKPKRRRRTKAEIAADRGPDLAREVENLPLAQLAAFCEALSEEVASYLLAHLRGAS